MLKDEWITEFVKALVLRYRKHLPPKIARTIAIGEYVTQGNADPDAAARRWVAKAKADNLLLCFVGAGGVRRC